MGRKVCRKETLIMAENFNCREKMLTEEFLIGEDFNWWRKLIWGGNLIAGRKLDLQGENFN